MYEILGSYSSQ